MANNRHPASTPRVARTVRGPERSPSDTENGAPARTERSHQHRVRRRAGRRLLVGFVVMAGVAFAVATDFLQFRVVAEHASAPQMAASVVRADHPDATH